MVAGLGIIATGGIISTTGGLEFTTGTTRGKGGGRSIKSRSNREYFVCVLRIKLEFVEIDSGNNTVECRREKIGVLLAFGGPHRLVTKWVITFMTDGKIVGD